MYIGDKKRIDISSSQFSDFIENGRLYVDKTAFIEHVLQDESKVLLFTRPRRMGKSLNMNTLATFLDCKRDTAHLFRGLYIETSPEFAQINRYPVIYLSFRELKPDDYKWRFKHNLRQIAESYLKEGQIGAELTEYFVDKDNNTTGALLDLTKNLHAAYGVKPYVLIDEYDKFLMDNIHSPELAVLKRWLTDIFGSALKDNGSLGKAVLTGVTRVAKENMFSGLNNLKVYDVLTASVYDTDFSLAESELTELVPEKAIGGVRRWYNNMRVGNTWLYNIYSVMNYLSDHERKLMGYWSMSGSDELLLSLLTGPRAEAIGSMLADGSHRHETMLDHRLTMDHLREVSRCSDVSFYTLAVQAGYLTFEPVGGNVYKVFIPNEEAKRVWARLLLDYRYNGDDGKLAAIFAGISKVDNFSKQLTEFVSMVLSYNDFKEKENAEWVYHVFFLGLVYSLGYKCKSNLEAGLGRFDIALKTPGFAAVIEFKVAKDADDKAMEAGVKEALAQIDEKEYWREFLGSDLPVYKIGISCHGKKCLAGTVLHVWH